MTKQWILPLALAACLLGFAEDRKAMARYLDPAVLAQGPDLFQAAPGSRADLAVAWQQAEAASNLTLEQQVAGAAGVDDGRVAWGFLDWLFDWFSDAKDEVTGPDYDDAGIPHDAFNWSYYGMNVQDVDTMTVADFERTLRFTGPWLRFTMHTDEVSESNWYRLEPGLSKIRSAGRSTGITPKVMINLSGYSNSGGGSDPLRSDLSWGEKASRYGTLASRLVNKVRSLGWGDVIYEAWNEPDNSSPLGIGPEAGGEEFNEGLSQMLESFSASVRGAGGRTAFSPFMSLNDSKIGTVKAVWNRVQSGFDYFSAHQYDDEPGKVKYWAEQTKGFTGNRPVLISEHGFQSDPKNADKYRRQAWALYQGFGADVLKGVTGYVYGSSHQPWAIDANEDFFWQVTHDSRP